MSFIEENLFDKKNIEFAQKVLEKIENDFILNTKYEGRITSEELDAKTKKLEEIIIKIKNEISSNTSKYYLSEENYKELINLAVSKGGFLSMKFRREIYKILLFFNEEQLSEKNEGKNNNKNFEPYFQYFKNVWINKENNELYLKKEYINQELIYYKDRAVIKADTIRSDINAFFPSVKYPYINELLKKRLEFALNILVNFNKCELSYFQGYHDIFILFFYLYLDSPYTYISIFQRFSELYIKENLMKQSRNNKGFTFPNCIKFCMEIIKQLNKFAYQDLVDYCNSEVIFIIPYIVSLFTHNMNNLNKRYRIIDYLIVSHPVTVYVMSSVLVVDEVVKLKAEYNLKKLKSSAFSFFGGNSDNIEPLNSTDFYVRFQSLDLDKLNFDELIMKTENEIKKINFEEIRKEFLGEKYCFEKYYPIMYSGKYLRDLTKIDEKKEVIFYKNDGEDLLYSILMKIYEFIYGKKKIGNKNYSKKTYFNNGIIFVISLFVFCLAYLIFRKLN